MQRDTLKRAYFSLIRVLFWLLGAVFVSLGVYMTFLGITELPKLISFCWLIFGVSLVGFGIYYIFQPAKAARVSLRDPRTEADPLLVATLSCDDGVDIGGHGLDCPDIGSPDFC